MNKRAQVEPEEEETIKAWELPDEEFKLPYDTNAGLTTASEQLPTKKYKLPYDTNAGLTTPSDEISSNAIKRSRLGKWTKGDKETNSALDKMKAYNVNLYTPYDKENPAISRQAFMREALRNNMSDKFIINQLVSRYGVQKISAAKGLLTKFKNSRRI